jgi:predicted phosphoribosyltransferase
VPVAFEIARALVAQLDVWAVKKLGVPWHPELGFGALAEGGSVYLNEDLVERLGLPASEVGEVIAVRRRELEHEVWRLRGDRPRPSVVNRTVIVVDDGIATGATVRAVLGALKAAGATRIILAVPVAAPESIDALRPLVDRIACPALPEDLSAVGQWYDDFTQVPDAEVARLLERARAWQPSPGPGDEFREAGHAP